MKIPMPSHDPKTSDFGSQMPPKVSKMSPRSDAKLIKFRKMLKMRNLMKTSVFKCFWEFGTSETSRFSNQESSKFVPAIQTCFLSPQITKHMKKLPKNVPNEVSKIHQKSSKIHLGTLKGPPGRTLAPNGHQTDAKVVPQDPQNAPKMVLQESTKSVNVYALLHQTHRKWFRWLNAKQYYLQCFWKV